LFDNLFERVRLSNAREQFTTERPRKLRSISGRISCLSRIRGVYRGRAG
jgi:hypothetical protein